MAALTVKRLLPPRQSRGTSYGRLVPIHTQLPHVRITFDRVDFFTSQFALVFVGQCRGSGMRRREFIAGLLGGVGT
jgi:hypothetical protein